MDKTEFNFLFNEYNRAIHLAQAGRDQEAAGILRNILPDFEKLYQLSGEPEILMKCLTALASVTFQLPDVDIAMENTKKVIEFAKTVGDNKRIQNFTRNLTKLYLLKGMQALNIGDLDNAIEIYIKARDLAKTTGDYRDEGRCLGNVATIYRMKGDPKLAIDFHKESLKLFKDYNYMGSYAIEYCNMANAYSDLKEFKKAFDIYTDVFENYSDKIIDQTYYSCVRGIAICSHQLGDWTTAQKYYTITLEIAEENQPIEEVENLKNGLRKVKERKKLE